MTKGIASVILGVETDFDDLFDIDIIGDGPSATWLESPSGSPLKYASIAYGTKGPDVGYEDAGVDVSNLWAAKGTAVYVFPVLPALIRDEQTGTSAPVISTASFSYLRHGNATWFPPDGSGPWTAPTGLGVGDAYDIRITQTGGNASGTLTSPTLATWLQMNTTRTVTLQYSRSSVGSLTATRTLLIEIRRRSDNVVVMTQSVTLEAQSDIS